MIRALVENGIIQPLEPLPIEWQNGRKVVVADLADKEENGADDFEEWVEDMNRLSAELNDPKEWEEIDATLAEADRQNKDLLRRQLITGH